MPGFLAELLVLSSEGDATSDSVPGCLGELPISSSASGATSDNPAFCSSAFFSSAFLFRAAAIACNLDIFEGGAPDPPSKPPRGKSGATKTAILSSGTWSHGVSSKNFAKDDALENIDSDGLEKTFDARSRQHRG